MKQSDAQAFSNLAMVRRMLTTARYYKQIDQQIQDIQSQWVQISDDMIISFEPYDGHFGFIARCLRISARTLLIKAEKEAGYSYLHGRALASAAALSDTPFYKWPEYEAIFDENGDKWSVRL